MKTPQKYLFFLLAFLSVGQLRAINLDSLLEIAQNTKKQLSSRAEAYLKWTQHAGDTTAVTEGYLIEAEKLARKAKNDKLLSEILLHGYYWYKGKGEMINSFRKILDHNELATRTLDTFLLARGYQLQGQLYLDIEVLPLAIESQKKAVYYFRTLNKPGDLSYHLYLLGWYSFNNGDYKGALKYFLESYEIQKKLNVGDGGLCEITGWIGNSYSGLFEYRDAFKYRFLSLNHAIKSKDPYYVGEAYRYLGHIHRKLGNLDSVLHYHRLAYENYNKTGFINRQGLMMIELARTLYEMENNAEAEKWMNMANENLSKYELFIIQMFEKQAGDVYAKSGNSAKALQFYIRYMSRRDSLEEAMQKNDLIMSNIKFQFENELEKLTDSKKKHDLNEALQRDKKKFRTILFISGGIFLLLFAFYAWWSARKRKSLIRKIEQLKNK
jgi:hypothetical protein